MSKLEGIVYANRMSNSKRESGIEPPSTLNLFQSHDDIKHFDVDEAKSGNTNNNATCSSKATHGTSDGTEIISSFNSDVYANTDADLTWDAEFNEDSNLLSGEHISNDTNWKKITDKNGLYYWNVDTGITQYETPKEFLDNSSEKNLETLCLDSVDSSLVDLEDAALRYASLQIEDENANADNDEQLNDQKNSVKQYSVRSLGWLPMNKCSSDPAISSADVNACIRHLSKTQGQIMDGVGAWGDGKSLVLTIDDTHLKIVEPNTLTVLQNQAIKHIRIWGIGSDLNHDFAYVTKCPVTHKYKCNVFRCDESNKGKEIAEELHKVCEKLSRKKSRPESNLMKEKEKIAMSTNIPTAKEEPMQIFEVKYLGSKHVVSVNGIKTIKDVIRDITTDDIALCQDATASVSASALIITKLEDSSVLVNCRMRCLSFMGVGDDIQMFAFINVIAGDAVCHVMQCEPHAAKIALAVQQACMLRLQKVVDSKKVPEVQTTPTQEHKSVRRFIKNIFSKKKDAKSP